MPFEIALLQLESLAIDYAAFLHTPSHLTIRPSEHGSVFLVIRQERTMLSSLSMDLIDLIHLFSRELDNLLSMSYCKGTAYVAAHRNVSPQPSFIFALGKNEGTSLHSPTEEHLTNRDTMGLGYRHDGRISKKLGRILS